MAEVTARISDDLGIIKFSNPMYNFLTRQMLEDFAKKLDQLYSDEKAKAIIVMSEGGIFSAGVDIKFIHSMAKTGNFKEVETLLRAFHSRFDLMSSGEKPVIAAVHGVCFGGGLELVLACNYIIVPADTQMVSFACPEVDYGIIPGLGATQRLPRRIDPKLALKMLLGGKSAKINAEQAKDLGLVDEIVAEEDFGEGIYSFAGRVLNGEVTVPANRNGSRPDFKGLSREDFESFAEGQPTFAAQLINSVVNSGLKLSMPEAWSSVELPALLNCLFTPDAVEGLSSFLEKRKPNFSMVIGQSGVQAAPAVVRQVEIPLWEKEEYQMLRETAREFTRKEIVPRIDEMEKNGFMPRKLFDQMGEMGFYGASFPEEYGGAGLGKVAYCIIFEELSRVHGSSAVTVGAHTGLACGSIFVGGNEAQKQKYLRAGIEGKMMGAFALTEPEAGSDAGNVQTRAVKKDNGWVLNGSKRFITNGKDADFTVVIAQTNRELGEKGLAAFIVETKWPGYKASRVEHKLGIQGSQTVELALENVFVPDENLLGEVGQGFKIFMKALNGGRLGLAAGCVGASKRALELASNWALVRKQFKNQLINFQNTQFVLAQIAANIYLMEQATYNTARMFDAGKDIRFEAACIKLQCSEMGFWNINQALQIFGGEGYSWESEIGRMWRDSRINPIFEGTNEIQKLLICKEVIKNLDRI